LLLFAGALSFIAVLKENRTFTFFTACLRVHLELHAASDQAVPVEEASHIVFCCLKRTSGDPEGTLLGGTHLGVCWGAAD